jgi:hypothetical protein
MGINFIALVRCPEAAGNYPALIQDLWNSHIPSVRGLRQAWLDAGGTACWEHIAPSWRWVNSGEIATWPIAFPCLDRSLGTRENFAVTFGHECILIYHGSPWLWFLTKKSWRKAILLTVLDISHEIGGQELVITNEFTCLHSLQGPFYRGEPYVDCVAKLEAEGHPCVSSVTSLYNEIVYDGVPSWTTQGYLRMNLMNGEECELG